VFLGWRPRRTDFVEIDVHSNSSFAPILRVGFFPPLGQELSLIINDARRLVDPMEIGDLVPFKFHVNHRILLLQVTYNILSGPSTNASRVIGRGRRP